MPKTLPLQTLNFGLADYQTVWTLQQELVQKRAENKIPDTLLMGEHEPIITLGRGSHSENLLAPTLPVVLIERGGDVTYHGPGQLVAYPIFLLNPERRDLHRYVRDLESVVIETLAHFGLEGQRRTGKTGVWVSAPQAPATLNEDNSEQEAIPHLLKIASIGVAVKRWVTYHGLALNISPDLSHFQQINPCGFTSDTMTAMSCSLSPTPSVQSVKEAMFESFKTVFGDLHTTAR
jgi:lipoyl(octanoyl) transferase